MWLERKKLCASSLELILLICEWVRVLENWNSAKASGACTSVALTHWFSESGYPFHLIRYCLHLVLPNCRWSRIFLTSYSSSPSINSGGGCVKFGP